jgi:hypothetical protein
MALFLTFNESCLAIKNIDPEFSSFEIRDSRDHPCEYFRADRSGPAAKVQQNLKLALNWLEKVEQAETIERLKQSTQIMNENLNMAESQSRSTEMSLC